MQVGDWVVIRADAPNSRPGMWVEHTMRYMADGFSVYQVSKADYGWITLENPYNHHPQGLNAATYTWHESWLRPASVPWQAAAPVPVLATGDAGTPKEDPRDAGETEQAKGKSEGDKPQKMTYSQTHEIIPQHPGESDKAYLRRILGGR